MVVEAPGARQGLRREALQAARHDRLWPRFPSRQRALPLTRLRVGLVDSPRLRRYCGGRQQKKQEERSRLLKRMLDSVPGIRQPVAKDVRRCPKGVDKDADKGARKGGVFGGLSGPWSLACASGREGVRVCVFMVRVRVGVVQGGPGRCACVRERMRARECARQRVKGRHCRCAHACVQVLVGVLACVLVCLCVPFRGVCPTRS